MTTYEPAKNPIESQPAQKTSEDKSENAPPERSPAEAHIPTSVKQQRYTEKTKGNALERYKVVEILTLLAIIWYACVASGQLTEMREATEATKTSAEAAKRTLEFTQRAFISFGKPETRGKQVLIPIENYGHVATHIIAVTADYYAVTGPGSPTPDRSAKAIDFKSVIPPGKGTDLSIMIEPPIDLPLYRKTSLGIIPGAIMGKVEYGTGFGGKDIAEFCIVRHPATKKWFSGCGNVIDLDFQNQAQPNQ